VGTTLNWQKQAGIVKLLYPYCTLNCTIPACFSTFCSPNSAKFYYTSLLTFLQKNNIAHAKKVIMPYGQLNQLLCEKWTIHYVLLSAMFNLLHNSMNLNLFEKHLCNTVKVITIKDVDDFHYAKKAIRCYYAKSNFYCHQDEWNTKRRTLATGDFMKKALCILQSAKRLEQCWAVKN